MTPVKPLPETECAAILSPCGTYRYTLERWWDRTRKPLVFVLLNPSTADAETDDPTLRRGVGFAKREGAGGLVFVNLFALRSTDPAALRSHADPVGPENDHHLLDQVKRVGRAVLAWGVDGVLLDRDAHVIRLLQGHELLCLGRTKHGHPRHPLYLPAEAPLVQFAAAAGGSAATQAVS
jgi:hypothetical protein